MASHSGGKMTYMYVFLARQGCVTKPLMLLLLLLAVLLHSTNGIECGGTVQGQTGTMSSPGYNSGTYNGPATCNYQFSNYGNYRVTLTFTAFKLPVSTSQTRDSDYVEIMTVNDEGNRVSQRYCGTDLAAGTIVHNVDPTYGLTFVSSQSDTANRYGFSVNFAYDQFNCGRTNLTGGLDGSLNAWYSNILNRTGECVYYITVDEGYTVNLAFSDLEKNFYEQCDSDFVNIYDGHDRDTAQHLGPFCNSQQRIQAQSSSNKMLVVVHTDKSQKTWSISANARYFATNDSTVCPPSILFSGSILKSPQYPAAYPTSTRCAFWNSRSQTYMYNGKVTFTDFNLPAATTTPCGYDGGTYVQVSNDRLCGSDLPPTYEYVDHVIFVSNDVTPAAYYRFHATYHQELNCRAINHDGPDEGQINSFISNPDQIEGVCLFNITVEEGYTILLETVQVNLPNALGNCSRGSVKVYDGNVIDDAFLIGSYCDTRYGTQLIQSTTNKILMQHYTSSGVTNTTYYIGNYYATNGSAVCGSVLNWVGSVIQSPGYPDTYPASTRCVYILGTNSSFNGGGNAYAYSLAFSSPFNLPTATPPCSTDIVKTMETPYGSGWAKYCEGTYPVGDVKAYKLVFVSSDVDPGYGYGFQATVKSLLACTEDRYGTDCANVCTCDSTHSTSCNHVTGACNCTAGWEGVTCSDDVDECAVTSCPANSQCVNTAGSYVCRCDDGYFKNSTGQCEGCAANTYGTNCGQQCTCTSNALSCDPVNGTCTCNAGWEGWDCETDANECLTNQHDCSGSHVICVNQDGGYECGCEGGYTYNSTDGTCVDVNECLDATLHDCVQVCSNVIGSYNCSCNASSVGTGNECTELYHVAISTTVDIEAPVGIDNPYGSVYAAWKGEVQTQLYQMMKPHVPGLRSVVIWKLKRGSLIILWDAILDTITDSQSTSDLTVALTNLTTLTFFGSQTGSVTLSINGVQVASSMTACEVFHVVYGECEAGTSCQVVDGKPACRPIEESEDSSLALTIALSVVIPITVLVALGAVLYFLYKKHVITQTSPIMVEVDEENTPIYNGPSKYSQMRPGSGGSTRSFPNPSGSDAKAAPPMATK